jgi:hypothetical protein
MHQSTTLSILVLYGFLLWGLAGCSKGQVPEPSGDYPARHAGGEAMARDLEEVDHYLEKWDRFARGQNQLGPDLKKGNGAFEAALIRLLKAEDKRAPARMVFYPVVQVGGFIPVDSDLGRACTALLGPDFPVTTSKDGERNYFSGDLYFWWKDNQKKFEPYGLLEEWSKRDFAKTVVVPMYESACKHR